MSRYCICSVHFSEIANYIAAFIFEVTLKSLLLYLIYIFYIYNKANLIKIDFDIFNILFLGILYFYFSRS